MRRPLPAFALVFAVGVVALLAFAAFEERDEAFTLGVVPALPLEVKSGQTLCQRPINVPVAFDGLRVTLSRPGAETGVEVRDATSGKRIASAAGRAGARGVVTSHLDRQVLEGRRVEVCLEGPVTVLGNAKQASRSSAAEVDGKPLKRDIAVVFLRSQSRSLLDLAPDMVARASLFHGSWVEPWMLGLLGVLLLTAFPLLLAVALRESSR